MTLGENYEYLIAWLVYIAAGLGFAIVWWRFTAGWRHAGWRELSRGFCLVFLYTPWYAGEQAGYFAPAIFVLMMDVLLEGTGSGASKQQLNSNPAKNGLNMQRHRTTSVFKYRKGNERRPEFLRCENPTLLSVSSTLLERAHLLKIPC